MSTQSRRIYEFGPFRLDAQEGVLLRDDRPLPLAPKVFDMLLILVESRGHLLPKEEMMSRLWPESFVEEVNVNRNISTLRRALADSPNDPIYIETVPKRGYRFVAPVVEVEAHDAEFILERRTSAEIITEEDEEITDSARADRNPDLQETILRDHSPSRASLLSRLRHRSVALSGVVMLTLFAAVIYLMVGRGSHVSATARVKSLAVLPFNDMGMSTDEHAGLGLADVLITRLSNLKEVNVRPTSAVLKFVGREQESVDAGRLLGVDAVLEGSIYRSQEYIRVTARLMRISDQSTIWSGQFDDKAKDVLAVQNAIAEQVANSLAPDLSTSEKLAVARTYSGNEDAYKLYAQGRYYWNKRSWPGMIQAEYFFRRAVERDPDFALAYVGLADRLFTNQAAPEAYTALNKALALDPNLAEAYATKGFAQMFRGWDWENAEETFKHAIELKPGYGTAHQWYATLLAITGRDKEAKQEMHRALEIDPMSPNFLADLGQMHYFAHEYEEAEAYCRKALEIEPDFAFAHEYLIDIYVKMGRETNAFEEYRKRTLSDMFDATPANIDELDSRVKAEYLQGGMNGFLRHRIADFGTGCTGACYVLAKSYATVGNREQALSLLEKSCEAKDFMLPFASVDPGFDDLRSEPRFQAVLRCLHLK